MIANVIDPRSTALVLIDCQNDVVGEPGSKIRAVVDEMGTLHHAARAAEGCRKLGVPVIFVRAERRHDLSDQVDKVTDFLLQGRGLPQSQLRRTLPGTMGWQFVAELTPEADDYLVVKRRTSALYATNLQVYLRARRVETLLLGGVYTHRGVESTVRDAWDRDFQVVVLSDCCAAYPLFLHEHAIKYIFPEFGRVVTADQALELMHQTASGSRE